MNFKTTFYISSLFLLFSLTPGKTQSIIPLDTAHWEISAQAYVLEKYEGKEAIYIQDGMAQLKDVEFLNGTIEFDIYLTERQSFPGVRFRQFSPGNMESFYLRPHLSGKPDGNQAIPVINSISAWQFYFGPRYSFAYDYNFDGWTHIKLVVNGRQAQVYLDHAEKPHLSWELVHEPQAGKVSIGGSFAPMHYANFSIDPQATRIVDFKPIERKAIEGLIPTWEVSDKFEEKLLDDPNQLASVIEARSWGKTIEVEEGTAANIARQHRLYDGTSDNTVFAKVSIESDRDQLKLLDFGYSDRVVVILNGQAIYRGNNKWRSRDYRYLGTVGLFDGVYLPLKKGTNTLLLAVSEDFGGWLVTGKIADKTGIRIQ